jgi:hypothetical protein
MRSYPCTEEEIEEIKKKRRIVKSTGEEDWKKKQLKTKHY